MSVLAKRLRKYRPTDEWGCGERHAICDEAADEIDRLNVQVSQYAYERDVARRERDEALTEKSK